MSMLDPRVQLIAVSGALDLATERRLHTDVSQAAGDPSRGLVIDLRGATFMDSSTLAVLVHADRHSNAKAADSSRVRQGAVERLLEATRLRHALAVFETPEAAVAHVLRNNA